MFGLEAPLGFVEGYVIVLLEAYHFVDYVYGFLVAQAQSIA